MGESPQLRSRFRPMASGVVISSRTPNSSPTLYESSSGLCHTRTSYAKAQSQYFEAMCPSPWTECHMILTLSYKVYIRAALSWTSTGILKIYQGLRSVSIFWLVCFRKCISPTQIQIRNLMLIFKICKLFWMWGKWIVCKLLW